MLIQMYVHTGESSVLYADRLFQLMINAHIDAMFALAEPFNTEVYHFGEQNITHRIQSLIPIMLNNRTTPPPEATYSLNRKLSGCFLLCSRLHAKVRCGRILRKVIAEP